ncbi:MAG: hypothetical protein WCW03_03090 [Candidatus Paceibacterota bacterium]|jgi:hypothetical protein
MLQKRHSEQAKQTGKLTIPVTFITASTNNSESGFLIKSMVESVQNDFDRNGTLITSLGHAVSWNLHAETPTGVKILKISDHHRSSDTLPVRLVATAFVKFVRHVTRKDVGDYNHIIAFGLPLHKDQVHMFLKEFVNVRLLYVAEEAEHMFWESMQERLSSDTRNKSKDQQPNCQTKPARRYPEAMKAAISFANQRPGSFHEFVGQYDLLSGIKEIVSGVI